MVATDLLDGLKRILYANTFKKAAMDLALWQIDNGIKLDHLHSDATSFTPLFTYILYIQAGACTADTWAQNYDKHVQNF